MKSGVKTLLIGYGNSLREDDGFGPAVAALLADAAGYECVSVHQLVPELCERIADFDRIVFVDVNAENPAGVFAVPLEQNNDPFGHTLSPWKLMAMGQELFGAKADFLIFSAGGLSFDHKEVLTPPLQEAAAFLAGYLKREFTS